MKTAVIISGDARTFMDCYPSLNACILSQNDCDLFLHLCEDTNTEQVLKTYSPKRFVVENKSWWRLAWRYVRHDGFCFTKNHV